VVNSVERNGEQRWDREIVAASGLFSMQVCWRHQLTKIAHTCTLIRCKKNLNVRPLKFNNPAVFMLCSQGYPAIRSRCQFQCGCCSLQNKHRNDGIWIWSSQMTAISICLCAWHPKEDERALGKISGEKIKRICLLI